MYESSDAGLAGDFANDPEVNEHHAMSGHSAPTERVESAPLPPYMAEAAAAAAPPTPDVRVRRMPAGDGEPGRRNFAERVQRKSTAAAPAAQPAQQPGQGGFSADTTHVLIGQLQHVIRSIEHLPDAINAGAANTSKLIADSVIEQAQPRLAQAVKDLDFAEPVAKLSSAINVDAAAKRIGQNVQQHVTAALLTRPVQLAVGVVAFLIFIAGSLVGAHLEDARLAASYSDRVKGLSYVPDVFRGPMGADLVGLASVNVPDALEDILQCRPEAGLHMVRATNGGNICVGSEGATRGWRIPPWIPH